MSIKKWSYIIWGIGIISLILIFLSPIHYIFSIVGLLVLAGGIVTSHITCRCPNCDAFLNAGIIFEASRKKCYCQSCGELINSESEDKL